jgi:hypothetical protein
MKRMDVRKSKRKPPFDPKVFLDTENSGRTISKYRKDQTLFSQGSPADAVFYIRRAFGQKIKTVEKTVNCAALA